MLDEIVVCPLKTLGELTAECMLTAMKGLKPFSSSSVCPLSSCVKWMINVDIGDSARANLKLQDFEVAARDSASKSRRGVLPLQCNSHLTHLCSSSQADSLDLPPSWSLAASAIASAVEAPPAAAVDAPAAAGAQGAQVAAAAAVEPPAAPEPAAEAAQGLPFLCAHLFSTKTNKYVVFTTIMLVVVVF
jgi:nucleoid-associated protein YgaU